MILNEILLGSNPFFDAYSHSDFLGKMIIIGLLIISLVSWTVLIHKIWLTRRVRLLSSQFQEAFKLQKLNPLSLDCEHMSRESVLNPFLSIYLALKKHTIDLINKNRRFTPKGSEGSAFLSTTDIDFVENYLYTTISTQTKNLEKNLFVLSTTVTLAPFLGLLGTVWGILTTFSELQTTTGPTNQAVIGGLSLALATTVLGLLDAIPALIGYNYLKTNIKDYETEMGEFSNEILASVELQYRKVDVHQ